jgi:DNA/RNA-binding domain of Phe-tRNA-synthetase-like protein
MPDAGALRAWVDPAIHARHRDYVTAVVVAAGLRNGPSDADSGGRLAAAEAGLRARGLTRAAEDAHLAARRQAFSAFGAKPSKYPSSAEALAARVLKGQPLPRINRLVDLYNAVSIRHLLPVGGEDSDRLEGPLRLVIAQRGEPFDPRGDGAAVEYAAPGEAIWRDDRGVTCRRWNWRQGARTQLTEDTRSAFFVLDRLAPMSVDQLDDAVAELSEGLRTLCPDAAVSVLKLTADQPEAA